jgi:hypothetical protein
MIVKMEEGEEKMMGCDLLGIASVRRCQIRKLPYGVQLQLPQTTTNLGICILKGTITLISDGALIDWIAWVSVAQC